ncbi:hypothetical protein MKW94_009210 [Papaver nudicaule]|uniref:Ribosomal protein L15 n=1 Tax=Papaver nudicaule TaxID=74823 RepID=A0AA41S5J2_PAPNU|nr:hypothetical protein [Papaver nudicaule]
MSAYTYVSEFVEEKQSDVMRFLQRVRCWEYCQQPFHLRCYPSSSAMSFTVYMLDLGGCKRLVPKGIVFGKRQNQHVTQLKFKMNKYFKIVLVDAAHNAVHNDPGIHWICNPVHKLHRKLCGLTSAGKKYTERQRNNTCCLFVLGFVLLYYLVLDSRSFVMSSHFGIIVPNDFSVL